MQIEFQNYFALKFSEKYFWKIIPENSFIINEKKNFYKN